MRKIITTIDMPFDLEHITVITYITATQKDTVVIKSLDNNGSVDKTYEFVQINIVDTE